MPRPTFADPKTDFAFKRIFGSEEHKDGLVAFLNAMLDLDEAHRLVGVELLPPEQRPPVAELKHSIVDVKWAVLRQLGFEDRPRSIVDQAPPRAPRGAKTMPKEAWCHSRCFPRSAAGIFTRSKGSP